MVMLNYKQAKSLFNSYVPKESVESANGYIGYIYSSIVEHQNQKSVYAGLVMMWAKKDITSDQFMDSVEELRLSYPSRLVKHITLGVECLK